MPRGHLQLLVSDIEDTTFEGIAKEWHYLKIPFISDRLNRKVTGIFKRENIPVRIAHKSYTLRQALSHNTTERKCNRSRPNCPIADTNLCLQRNTVYQLTCKACGEYYIGSTTRFLHDRTKEHLANDNSSVKKHLTTHHWGELVKENT